MTGERPERPLLPRVLLLGFAASLVGAALVLPFRTFPEGWLWTQAPFAVLAGASVGLLLADAETLANGARLLLVLFLGSALLVAMAVIVGAPFGRLYFTANLGPRIGGVLPVGVPFLWVAVVGGSMATARSLLGVPQTGWSEPLRLAATTATVATMVSLCLDPVARVLRLWAWEAPGRFDGVPLLSFVGWWTTTLVIAVAAFAAAPRLRLLRVGATIGPILVLLLLVLLLLGVAVRTERSIAVTGGAASLVVLVLALVRARAFVPPRRSAATPPARGVGEPPAPAGGEEPTR